ncbi:hypothetical protein NTG1052_520070 [Candidatus Nitrotoga sp. 1052]|nr:hypothetical protein NTG1052_520070 [Candidatus Nitrotoga sp. 1052]
MVVKIIAAYFAGNKARPDLFSGYYYSTVYNAPLLRYSCSDGSSFSDLWRL